MSVMRKKPSWIPATISPMASMWAASIMDGRGSVPEPFLKPCTDPRRLRLSSSTSGCHSASIRRAAGASCPESPGTESKDFKNERVFVIRKGNYAYCCWVDNPVMVGEGVLEGEAVAVGVLVFVGDGDAVGDRVGLGVMEGVRVGVNVAVLVAVYVGVGGWKGVLVMVGVSVSVGVEEAVSVNEMIGVRLLVAVEMVKVSVAVAMTAVFEGVGVGAFGSGANCTAIQPRQ